jgi:hypothetical protein
MSSELDQSDLLRYVGPADLHDAVVTALERIDNKLRVDVRTDQGRPLMLEFFGVADVHAVRPVGMMLYALSERKAEPPMRRFDFANWDDDDDATIVVVAQGYRCDDPSEPSMKDRRRRAR